MGTSFSVVLNHMVTLRKYNAQEFDKNIKATIQKSGKLGFSESAIHKLDLASMKGVTIAGNEADTSDESLYMVLEREEIPSAFRLNKAGVYYYLNAKPLFDSLNIDYQKATIIFDIIQTEFQDEGKTIYKMVKRVIPRNLKDKGGQEESTDE